MGWLQRGMRRLHNCRDAKQPLALEPKDGSDRYGRYGTASDGP